MVVNFAGNLTGFELCGPLVMLCGAPEMYRSTELLVYVNNQEAVDI